MAKIFDLVSQQYTQIDAVATSALTAGQYVSLNEVVGFPLVDVADTETYALVIKADKVNAVKLAGVTFVAGEDLFYVAGTTNVTNVASTNVYIGTAYEASASASLTCKVVFDGTVANTLATISAIDTRVTALENA